MSSTRWSRNLLLRLDAAIADAYENDRFIDEVNASTASGSRRPRR
jgi:hypothetical protein